MRFKQKWKKKKSLKYRQIKILIIIIIINFTFKTLETKLLDKGSAHYSPGPNLFFFCFHK